MTTTASTRRPISTLTRVHTYSENHYVSKCTIRDILKANIVNWEYNRPPDVSRCTEIAAHIYTRRPNLDWILYMTYDIPTNTFYVIDGIHRYTSLTIIATENSKPLDFLTPNIFGGNRDADWLYDKYILICIRANLTKGETVDWFQTLNKSNPVPELYIANTSEIKRQIIEQTAQDWMAQFKTHFSGSQKPNIPNTNRDRFIDLLDSLYEKYRVSTITAFTEKVNEANHFLREHPPKKVSTSAVEKCRQTGCYLFIVSKDVLLEMI